MSEEEKKKADELAAAALASEQKKKEEGIDYKAEFEKVSKEKADKEKELSQAQYKIQELKKKKIEEDDDDTLEKFDKEELFKLAREEARKEVERAQSGFVQDSLQDALASSSSDPAERELIKFHYENSIKQSGFSRAAIAEDIQKAKALANKAKFEKMESELVKATQSKKTTSNGSAGYSEPKESIELSEAEENWIQIAAKSTGQTVDKVRATLIANKGKR